MAACGQKASGAGSQGAVAVRAQGTGRVAVVPARRSESARRGRRSWRSLSPGHPHARAFLSHGGLNSIFETMYHGVPVVGIPLFGDHYDTMTRVQAKGMGLLLEWTTLTEAELHTALVRVITEPR